jgi:RNA polymerase-binding transcription factor DksA
MLRTGERIQLREVGLSTAARAEQQIDQFIAAEESETLIAIHGALQLLHDQPERYGVCKRCGRSLSAAQLRFSPWISSCERHADMPAA